MAAQKAKPPRVGEISQGGNSIPIYGMPEISLGRSGRWDVSTTGPQSIYVIHWQGEDAIEISLNFELVAGITAINRDELFDFMKRWHSLAAHRFEGDSVKPPAPCTLILGEYINSVGILRDANAVAKGPWGGSSGTASRSSLMPTAVVFSGVFVIAPGYNGDLVSVDKQNAVTAAESVNEKFYRS